MQQTVLSTEAPGSRRAHEHARVRAHLHACRCSRRSGRSSEPGSEAGTHPRDGQGRTLSSARPHGSGKRQDVDARQRAPDLRADALRTTCASTQGILSSQRASRGYTQVALACEIRNARTTWVLTRLNVVRLPCLLGVEDSGGRALRRRFRVDKSILVAPPLGGSLL